MIDIFWDLEMGNFSFLDNLKIVIGIAIVLTLSFFTVKFIGGLFDEKRNSLSDELRTSMKHLDLDLIASSGGTFERNSDTHRFVEEMALKGSLKATHILGLQHFAGFEDEETDLREAEKLLSIAMPEKLPDTFFILSVIKRLFNPNELEIEHSLIKMGLDLKQVPNFGRFENIAVSRLDEIEKNLSTSQKLQVQNFITKCVELEFKSCF